MHSWSAQESVPGAMLVSTTGICSPSKHFPFPREVFQVGQMYTSSNNPSTETGAGGARGSGGCRDPPTACLPFTGLPSAAGQDGDGQHQDHCPQRDRGHQAPAALPGKQKGGVACRVYSSPGFSLVGAPGVLLTWPPCTQPPPPAAINPLAAVGVPVPAKPAEQQPAAVHVHAAAVPPPAEPAKPKPVAPPAPAAAAAAPAKPQEPQHVPAAATAAAPEEEEVEEEKAAAAEPAKPQEPSRPLTFAERVKLGAAAAQQAQQGPATTRPKPLPSAAAAGSQVRPSCCALLVPHHRRA